MKVVVVTAPVAEPITLDEAKFQLRIDGGDEDTLLSSLISASRDYVEQYCGRYFTTTVINYIYESGFPIGDLEVPYPDLTSVDAIVYTDTDGAVQTYSDGYTLNSGRQTVTPTDAWPTDAISVQATMTTAAPVEFKGARQAMLMYLTDLYEVRGSTVIGSSVVDNPAANAIMQPYRVNLGI